MHASQAAGTMFAIVRKFGVVLGAAWLIALVASASAVAATAWMPAQDLSAPGRDATDPVAAMAANGSTVIVWERRDDFHTTQNVEAATREAGAQFAPPVRLASQAWDPTVAMTPGGEAIAAWWHFRNPPGVYVLQVATRGPGGAFSAPADVMTIPSGISPPAIELDVNAAGAAVLAWSRPVKAPDESAVNIVEAAVRPAGGAFSEPVALTEALPEESASEPAVAIDGAGRPTVAWAYKTATERLIQAAAGTGSGFFPAAEDVSTAGTPAFFPELAAAPGGETVLVWTQGEEPSFVVNAASRVPGGSFGAPDPISGAGEDSRTPTVGIADNGSATALWLNRVGSGDFAVEAAERPAGGAFGAPTALSTPEAVTQPPSLAVSGSGAALAVWSEEVAGGGQVPAAATRLPGAAFGAPAAIGVPDPNFFRISPAVSAAGDATAAWSQAAGGPALVKAAGFDAGAPTIAGLAAPAAGTVGEPVHVSMSAFDVWPSGRLIAFGDGAVAPGAAASHVYGAPGTYLVTATITDPIGNVASQSRPIRILASNHFSIRKRQRNRKKGRIRLRIVVAGPGRVVVSGRGVIRRQVRAREAGPVTVFLRTKGKTRKRLNRKGKVRTRVKVAFLPDGGPRAQRTVKLVFVKKLSKRKNGKHGGQGRRR